MLSGEYLCCLNKKTPTFLGEKVGVSEIMPVPDLPRGRILRVIRFRQVSWLAAAYFPRLPGLSPVAEAGFRLKVNGLRLKDSTSFFLAPYALRLAVSCGLRSVYSCGAAGALHPLP